MDTRLGIPGAPTPLQEPRLLAPALNRALYECIERIHATKAALYLGASHTGSEAFELVTSYGWTAPPARLDRRNPVVSRLLSTQMPLMVNSVAADRVVAEALFEQGCERVLAVPIFGRERLAGIIDMRDKAGRKPFEAADVAAADAIRQEIENVLAAKKLYGVGPVSLVEAPKRRRGASAKYSGVSLRAETLVRPEITASPGAVEVIRAARERMSRRPPERDAARRLLSRDELETLRVVLPAVLAIPGVLAGALTNLEERERQIVV